jgi:hypothetical protein
MRLWCRALGHGAPWVTITALDLHYHLCPRCGRNVFEPADFLPRRARASAGDAISLVVLLAGAGLAVLVLL